MLSDFELLGIPETQDGTVIKNAYRRRVKEIHPDIAGKTDPLKNHLLFIQINHAYKRLLNQTKSNRENRVRVDRAATTKNAVTVHKDPAYVFYKTGMKYFMQIHPSQWNLETQRRLNTPIPGKEQDQEKIRAKVRELARSFPKAYYYFSMVAHEYPDSLWAADSQAKMTVIEERTLRYKKIIDSFGDFKRRGIK
jgi:hypothetical protein